MSTAVTGAAGFIGQALMKVLADRGADPIALDLPGHDVASPAFELPAGAGHVIHLAGVLGTAELFGQVDRAIAVNVAGTAHVLEAARRAGAGYTGITVPPVFPSIYAATKAGALALEQAYQRAYGMRVSRVRAYNVYGPGQKHGPGHPQKIIPTFASAAWAGRPLPVWGDGRQWVDLVHVDDVARMLADAARFGDGETFDAGTGVPLAVNEVAARVIRICGSASTVVHLPMRTGEVPTEICAAGAGWDRIGWRPQFRTDHLADAVRSYLDVDS